MSRTARVLQATTDTQAHTASPRKRVTWDDDGAGGVACETRAYVVEHAAPTAPTVRPLAHPTRPLHSGGGREGAARRIEHDELRALAAQSAPPVLRRAVDADAAARQAAAQEDAAVWTALGAGQHSAPRARRPGSTAWATALIVFAGPGHESDLAARLRARGVAVTVVDTKVGGGEHDVRRQDVGERLVRRVRRGDYDVVFAAPPCESFSVAHRPQLRSRRQPAGLANAPDEWKAYLRKHNELAAWTTRLAQAAHDAGALWAVENPADRGVRGSPAHWEGREDHAPLWAQECVLRLAAQTEAASRTFAYCAFGAEHQKYTTVMHSTEWTELGALDRRQCEHGRVQHDERLRGRLASGASRAGRAAAYPDEMNEFIAAAAATALRRRGAEVPAARTAARAAAREVGRGGTAQATARRGEDDGLTRGGRVGEGWELSEVAARACDEARRTTPRFASARNKRPSAASALRVEALPGDLHAPPTRTRPAGAHGKGEDASRRPAPRGANDGPHREAARLRAARLAEGPVAIHELYLEGVYAQRVEPWMQLADRAAAAVRARRSAPSIPTVTITQDEMPLFARFVVWDCADPADCRPVERSDRHTIFPCAADGEPARQVDRAAFRRVAAELGWDRVDADIISQIGEGGVEARSTCALETVLAWHHTGVADHPEAATAAVEKDWAEGWAGRPTRHLPFVPCRVLPRNVIMQERVRLLPGDTADGRPRIEAYDKPRVTQNSSHGGEDSVNAGVDDDETFVQLPTVQRFARGWAICDTAGEAGGARAEGYVVDAESAYRFCPLQRADWWTQCFMWWDDDGQAGVCVDRRLGFGGAYAPNRFERVSTMCAAYAQHLQAGFDGAQPPPAAARRWSAVRAARQDRGELPTAAAQVEARYIQVFIDDFTGAALNDKVVPPTEVSDIVIDERNSASTGAVPSPRDTRVHVHAQLTVLALRRLGLSAAPNKVVVGNPIIALGFTVERGGEVGDGVLKCPELKRQSMRSAGAEARALALDGKVLRKPAERLVGRLCNISQALPEVKCHLGGGYAVTRSSWEVGGVRRQPPKLALRRGGGVQTEWIELLDLAEDVLEANEGVALAPEHHFPEREMPGAVTVVTDASGVDGVGGYALDPARPGEAWLVSEKWPTDVQAALDRMALKRAERESAADAAEGRLSMPAAETFGCWAVAQAYADYTGMRPTAVTAVGDCDPAAAALNAAASGKPQMRQLLRGARALCTQWLGVSLPRDLNLDADRLSHPALIDEVRADALAAGMVTHLVPIPPVCWEVLSAAIAAEAATRRTARKRKAAPPVTK